MCTWGNSPGVRGLAVSMVHGDCRWAPLGSGSLRAAWAAWAMVSKLWPLGIGTKISWYGLPSEPSIVCL